MDTNTVVAVGVVGLVALVSKLIDFLRNLSNLSTKKSAVITQLTAWVAGILAVLWFAATQFADTVTVAAIRLDHMDFPTKLLVGLSIGSAASVLADAVRSQSPKLPV